MNKKKLRKPEHLKDDVWRQRLEWLDVMGKQVDQNFARHQARVQEDASRSKALSPIHDEVLQAPHRTQHLFSTPKH